MNPNTEAGFFHDIREHPQDDTPRLVYADWLEEQGDETDRLRADLIRVQCQTAAVRSDNPAAPGLLARESELLDELDGWFAPLRALVQHVEIHRGFVEAVTLQSEQLLAHADVVSRLAPVAELTLTVHRDEWERVLDCPGLRLVTRLEARGGSIRDDGVQRLARSPHVGSLRALILHHCGITEVGFAELLHLDLSRLTVLNLGANNLHDAGMELLCGEADLSALELLSLGANELYLRSARALADSPHLHRLQDINLGANYLDDESIHLLAAAPHLASLRRLDVRSNEFHSRGALALAGSPHLEALQFLDVSGNHIRGRSRSALVERFGDRVQF